MTALNSIQRSIAFLQPQSVVACSRLSRGSYGLLSAEAIQAKSIVSLWLETRYNKANSSNSSGASSDVYPVKDTVSGITYMMKVPHEDFKTKYSFAEAQFLEQLQGKERVIQFIRSFFNVNQRYVIVMEHFVGLSLWSRQCAYTTHNLRFKRLEIISIFKQALLALIEIRGIIHGDIKPGNILWDPNNNILKLIDFGLSQSAKSETRYKVVQSPWYRAPEVVLGQQYDESIDMWSLGCTIYELCTHRVLFPASDPADLENENKKLLIKFISLLGIPSDSYLKKGKNKYVTQYFAKTDTGYELLPSIQREIKQTDFILNLRANCATNAPFFENIADLLTRILRYENRITPEKALTHPLFQ